MFLRLYKTYHLNGSVAIESWANGGFLSLLKTIPQKKKEKEKKKGRGIFFPICAPQFF
jgi:hypothetical protein